eukprot:s3521_g8.t1
MNVILLSGKIASTRHSSLQRRLADASSSKSPVQQQVQLIPRFTDGRYREDIRAYNYSTWLQIPAHSLCQNLPLKFCAPTFSERTYNVLHQGLRMAHVSSNQRQPGPTYKVIDIRRLHPWQFWVQCQSAFRTLDGRVASLERQLVDLQQQLQALQISAAGSSGSAPRKTGHVAPRIWRWRL